MPIRGLQAPLPISLPPRGHPAARQRCWARAEPRDSYVLLQLSLLAPVCGVGSWTNGLRLCSLTSQTFWVTLGHVGAPTSLPTGFKLEKQEYLYCLSVSQGCAGDTGTGSGGRWLSALQAPPLPPALLKQSLIVTVESRRCLNPEIPGTPRGSLDMPHPPRLPRAMPTHSRAESSHSQALSCLSGPTWILEKPVLLPEGEPRKDPHFPPWVGL